MTNPIPQKVRSIIYLACVILGAAVLNVPDIIAAVQTGDWSGAAFKVSATLTIIGGIVAQQNITPDTEILTASVEDAESLPDA